MTIFLSKLNFYASEHIKYVNFDEIACIEHLSRILAPVPSFSDLYGLLSYRCVSDTQSRLVIAQVKSLLHPE